MASTHCRYSGLSTLRKLARHQIMKTWPIFSSTLNERSVFAAHLSPCVALTGAGCGCLVLANAGRERVRMRNMARQDSRHGETIAEEKGFGVPMLLWGQPPSAVLGPKARCSVAGKPPSPVELRSTDSRRRLSPHVGRLRVVGDSLHGFPLDLRIVAEALQPRNFRLAPEPCHLALGIVAMCLLRGLRLPARELSSPRRNLDRLLVSERSQWPRGRAVFFEQNASSLRSARSRTSRARARLMRLVECGSIRIESYAQNAESLQRIPPLLPQFRHLLPRRQANLDRPNQLGDIVGMDFLSGSTVETPQNSVQMTPDRVSLRSRASARAIPPSAAGPGRVLRAAHADTVPCRRPRWANDRAR